MPAPDTSQGPTATVPGLTAPVPGSGLRRGLATGVILGSLAIVTVAQRDLSGRPAPAVRGSKLAWRIGSTNALVALAYLRWGRRPVGA
ncbi:hypothetical protein [Conexibacter sp. DBS9H8]|uniref:hypothetical protein n=1 Tax=Conexibacter sp. DBS9H8 TaxID=2937801 RepID=UPI00200DC283|nr:hypothetical protein [Conexibacter sp. DBS9H8]